MKISVKKLVDLVYGDLKDEPLCGLALYKRSLPKDAQEGAVIRATEITFDENQQAIFFIMCHVPDVISNGNYEINDPRTTEIAETFASRYDTVHPTGASYRYELQGQSLEAGDDSRSHIVSNRYLFSINTED